MITTADIDALTERQRDVLGEIAIGMDLAHNPRVVKALLAKGMIEEHTEAMYGYGPSVMDRIPIMVKVYTMPLPVHYIWCLWCSEHITEEEAAELGL